MRLKHLRPIDPAQYLRINNDGIEFKPPASHAQCAEIAGRALITASVYQNALAAKERALSEAVADVALLRAAVAALEDENRRLRQENAGLAQDFDEFYEQYEEKILS